MDKKYCFGYNPERNKCMVLKELYCDKEECKFFKPIGTVDTNSKNWEDYKYGRRN